MPIVPKDIEAYAAERSEPLDALLDALVAETHQRTEWPMMLSGPLGGGLLRMIARLIGAKRALEVGMFTGYSALAVAEALPHDGELIACELSEEFAAIAQSYFDRSEHGHKIHVEMGPALDSLARIEGPFDLAFIDADKPSYDAYYEACLEKLRPGGALCIDNALWGGSVLDPQDDKSRALDALNRKIENDERVDRLLLPVRDGIFIVRKRAQPPRDA